MGTGCVDLQAAGAEGKVEAVTIEWVCALSLTDLRGCMVEWSRAGCVPASCESSHDSSDACGGDDRVGVRVVVDRSAS